MQLFNRTSCPAGLFVDIDRNGAQVLALAVKATYDLMDGDSQGHEPALSRRQRDLAYADIFSGAPGASSLLYESDANWGRTGTDIAFVGHAYPARAGDREVEVQLHAGELRKAAHVSGERHWKSRFGSLVPSAPQPFERVAILYENAFGGVDDSTARRQDAVSEPRNPVGCGLRARDSRRAPDSIRLPNVEDPKHLVRSADDRPDPAGFGFVAKAWQPRASFVGTYDAAWQANRMPLLPTDFDPQFYRAASQGLGSSTFLRGGEPIELVNLTPQRRTRFTLPALDVHAAFGVDARITPLEMHLDVVLIDTAGMKLVLVWHGWHDIEGLIDDIGWVQAEAAPRH